MTKTKAVEARPANEILVPGVGELVNLEDVKSTGEALDAVRGLEAQLRDVKRILTDALVEASRVQGTKTLTIGGRMKIEIRGGSEKAYDAEQLERELRELGMPEERLRQIVREEITYSVSAREAQKAAKANDDYAAALDRATVEIQKPYTASIRRK